MCIIIGGRTSVDFLTFFPTAKNNERLGVAVRASRSVFNLFPVIVFFLKTKPKVPNKRHVLHTIYDTRIVSR